MRSTTPTGHSIPWRRSETTLRCRIRLSSEEPFHHALEDRLVRCSLHEQRHRRAQLHGIGRAAHDLLSVGTLRCGRRYSSASSKVEMAYRRDVGLVPKPEI